MAKKDLQGLLDGLTDDPDDADDGGRLGRFAVRGELGRGGMGRVLLVHDPELGREVALKEVNSPEGVSQNRLARFVREARVTAQLQHPNIVPVHEMGATDEGQLFFVMTRIEGRSLQDVLESLRSADPEEERRWTRHRLLTSFIQVCNAMAFAHSRGVLHRDLKPSNVMLGEFGEVYVVDWGLARSIGEPADEVPPDDLEASRPSLRDEVSGLRAVETLDGTTVGTPGYMSPEQAEGRLAELDERSDVWSLGALLYELLTLRRAYQHETTLLSIAEETTHKLPADPRERAPDRHLPEEIVQICLKAMEPGPGERFASVTEMGQAVEDFLEGSRRRAAAEGHLDSARSSWEWCRSLKQERLELQARAREVAGSVEPWAPLSDKAELLATRKRLQSLRTDIAEAYAHTVSGCEQALSQHPEHPGVRALLAEVYLERYLDADVDADEASRRYYERRVRQFDDGRFAALLQGDGALTLVTDPPGALVICERFEPNGLIHRLVERRMLGTTPLREVPLEMGSYLLQLRAPGRAVVRYPVHITRGLHWRTAEPVPLYSAAQIGDGFLYVPPGPCRVGGDPLASDALPDARPSVPGFFVAELPVTMREYVAFLNALHERDLEAAWGRAPRKNPKSGQYLARPGPGERYDIPEVDPDGDSMDARWPVMAISWHDAMEYVAWRSEEDRAAYTLPSDLQWEKAARGVDGRLYPWGDGFDPTLCKMRQSRPGRPLPEPVGAFPSDVSVYGVRDLGGSSRDWIGELEYDGDPQRRSVRGGSWTTHPRVARAATRFGHTPWNVATDIGLRLVRDRPKPG